MSRIQIRCPWEMQFSSMKDPDPPHINPITHDLRLMAQVIMEKVGGDHECAAQLLRELTAPREQIDIPEGE